MLDPIPPPPSWLTSFLSPYTSSIALPTLPYHIHEVLGALVFYTTIQTVVSPAVSTYLFPHLYPNFPRRTRINWDVHFVSLVQSCIINTLAIWVMRTDTERSSMTALERIYGYTGGCGLIQGLATGYFLWDLIVSARYVKISGPGTLAHAVSALWVFSFGFRPFLNYYGPTFILYELSTPFLNFHWFFDKVNMTGSPAQWYNGILLIATFFGCRLVWGTYQSVRVYQDVWMALMARNDPISSALNSPAILTSAIPIFTPRDNVLCLNDVKCVAASAEVIRFAGPGNQVPVWLAVTYMTSNMVLNSLNFYWFGKMIETVRKRFEKKPEEKREKIYTVEGADGHVDGGVRPRGDSVVLAAADGIENDEMRMGFEVTADAEAGKSSAIETSHDARKRN